MTSEAQLNDYWNKLEKRWKEKFNNDFNVFKKEIADGTARIFENGYEESSKAEENHEVAA